MSKIEWTPVAGNEWHARAPSTTHTAGQRGRALRTSPPGGDFTRWKGGFKSLRDAQAWVEEMLGATSEPEPQANEWKNDDGTWTLQTDDGRGGTVHVSGSDLQWWHAKVLYGAGAQETTTRYNVDDAKRWVEQKLAEDAKLKAAEPQASEPAREAQLADVLTRIVRSIGPRMERDGTEAELALVGEALALLRVPAEPAAQLETDQERAEREFQEARAKWNGPGSSISDLCDAIRAGYDAEHGGLDDDMVQLLVDLGDRQGAIVALVEAARAASEWMEERGVVHDSRQALEAALRGF